MSHYTGDKSLVAKLVENTRAYIQLHERQVALHKEILKVCLILLKNGGDIHTRKRVIELLQTIIAEEPAGLNNPNQQTITEGEQK